MKNWEYCRDVLGISIYENLEAYVDSIMCPTDYDRRLHENIESLGTCGNKCRKCWELNVSDDLDKVEKISNEFRYMSAMIITYNLDINKVRKIINRLSEYECDIYKERLSKETLECELKGYLINPDSKRAYVFKQMCNLNGLIQTLDDLSLEYCNSKSN